SSDWAGSRTIRLMMPSTQLATWSYTASKACSSPRATAGRSASSHRGPCSRGRGAAPRGDPPKPPAVTSSSSVLPTVLYSLRAPPRLGQPANPRGELLRMTSVNHATSTLARFTGLFPGLLAGLLSGAVGVCVGIGVAGFTGPVGSPVAAVA